MDTRLLSKFRTGPRQRAGARSGGNAPVAVGGVPDADVERRSAVVLRSNARHGAVPFLAATIGFILLLAEQASGPAFVLWGAAVVLVAAARAVFVFRLWPEADAPTTAVRANALLLGALGVLYGMSPVWLAGATDFWFLVVANLWLVGLAFAALLSQGIMWRAGLAFALPVVIPLLLFLLPSGDGALVMLGLGDIGLSVYLFTIVGRTRAVIIEETGHRLRFEKLARHHELQRRRSDRLVDELTDEIERRKLAEAALKEARDAAEHMSNQDHLTSLANRRVFDRELARAWSRAAAAMKPLSMIACDIDLFRSYNEHYGNHAGDCCLVLVGEAIRRSIDETRGFACRDSGDQFAILLPGMPEREALELAESIRTKIHDLTIMHTGAIVERVVTASFGVATLVPDGRLKPASLVESADHALRRAKRCGGNCVFAIYGDVASDER